MRIVAFCGPSLRGRDRGAFRGIDWRPPAQAGDLLQLSIPDPTTVCLIDGYFDHRPAVRHKEILWLLSEGVRIIGASSIGALRATEMRSFGMVGIGAIFGAYARGALKGDDEVALIHAGPEQDWRPLSVPLVDVRATLCRARRQRMVGRDEARRLLSAAASIHYIDRDWKSVCAAAGSGAGSPEFERWLQRGAVSQKHDDALACVRAATESAVPLLDRPEPVRTSFLHALAGACGVALDEQRRDPGEGRAAMPG